MSPMGDDIAAVRRYFSPAINERVSDERIEATLDWFKGTQPRYRFMFAARSIVRSFAESDETAPFMGEP